MGSTVSNQKQSKNILKSNKKVASRVALLSMLPKSKPSSKPSSKPPSKPNSKLSSRAGSFIAAEKVEVDVSIEKE